MRDIKFRAWNPDSKVMIVFCGNSFKDQFIAHHFGLLVSNEHPEGVDLLMQFTGLKDRNGIDIYEGDIVMWGGDVVETVSFIDCMFQTESSCIDSCMTVIGNIHQSPELLEK